MIKMLYEPFQKWSVGGSVWIISDPHFGDADCKLIDEKWPTPEEYVKAINLFVKKNDTLICLGDCGDPSYFDKINAKYKVLIMGNHDKGKSNYKPYFNEIYEGPLMIAPKILLSHEPALVSLPGYCCNIHGHLHNDISAPSKVFINLAANKVNYLPFNLGYAIKNGLVSKIHDIHRREINIASNKKKW